MSDAGAPGAKEAEIPARTRRALAAAGAPTGLLIAEGDSWFDYPMNDVLSMLEDEHGFDVEAVAHKGDTLEDMAFGEGQFDDFVRLLEKLLRQGRVPDAILLSGAATTSPGTSSRRSSTTPSPACRRSTRTSCVA